MDTTIHRPSPCLYQEPLRAWLEPAGITHTSFYAICQHYDIPEARWKDQVLQKDLAQALRALGFVRSKARDGAHIRRVWVKPTPQEPDPILSHVEEGDAHAR